MENTTETNELEQLFAVKKGRVLRLKQGYNPNSSSMGSIVFCLPVTLMGITAVYGVLAGMMLPGLLKKSKKNEMKADDNEPDKTA